MSLINEALKKAQRLRHDAAAPAAAPGAETSGPVTKRGQPKSARSTLLIVVGAVVLVVASMVGTALWLTRPTKPTTATTVAAARPAEAKSEPLPEIKPMVSIAPAAATPAKAEPSQGKEPTPAPARPAAAGSRVGSVKPATPATVTSPPGAANSAAASSPLTPAPAESTVASATTSPIPEPAKRAAQPDERIHKLVESLKVMGIRSSGADSKVLMNDRVYRVNDFVDRTLGVRLTKVSSDSLTFTDANGVTYVKYF